MDELIASSPSSSSLVSSRRKQQKPAKLLDTMMTPSNAQCSSSTPTPHSTSVIVRVADLNSTSNQQHKVDGLSVGTILGPFVACKSVHKNDCSKCQNDEGNDIAVLLKSFNLNENKSQEPEIIRITGTTNGANCELFESDGNLYIRINRSIQRISELRASSVSLSCVHQAQESSSENGCSSSAVSPNSTSALVTSSSHDVVSSSPSTSTDFSGPIMAPHAIYLPVAFHDSGLSSMQVVGYPQIVIPVAISRNTAHHYTPSLLVDETLSRGLQLPTTLSIGNTLLKVDKMPHATAANKPEVINESIVSLQQHKCKSNAYPRPGMKRHSPLSSDNKPLDLSLHVKEKRTSTTTTVKRDCSPKQCSPIETAEKRFRCECGVSFNSETTLQGHRKYYCNSVSNHAEVNREPQKKVITRCQQCEFQPISANQLAQHVRSNHSTVRAYVCRLCGYKGYSQRGIRSHLRTHSECSNGHNDDLLRMHVCITTPDSLKLQCGDCRQTFISKQLMKQHICEQILQLDSL